MKLAQVRRGDRLIPAALGSDGIWRDVSALTPALTASFAMKAKVDPSLREAVDGRPAVDLAGGFGPPLSEIGKIVCIGLNYRDHAAETGADIPSEPIIFLKAADTTRSNDGVRIPRGSEKTDWEVELGVVIGAEARYLTNRPKPPRASPGTCSATTSANAPSSSNGAVSGTRARTARPSIPSDLDPYRRRG